MASEMQNIRWSFWRHVARPSVLAVLIAISGWTSASSGSSAQSAGAERWPALGDGAIVLIRHAEAPGTGDPVNFKLGDCSTQRNLDDRGRAQAKRIGEAFRARGVTVGQVVSSQWCRCVDTAELAFPGRVTTEPAFNSFFDSPGREAGQTADAKRLLRAWSGPGVLVVVTHQVNITALTGVVPSSGEMVVVGFEEKNKVAVRSRIKP